jgi:hypothetical protein
MPYTPYLDCAMPYQLDGTVVKQIDATAGVVKTFSAAEMVELNDEDYSAIALAYYHCYNCWIILFFPELVDITQIFTLVGTQAFLTGPCIWGGGAAIEWSPDSTNGLDGTWNAATVPDGYNANTMNLDSWRTGFKAMTGVTGAIALRIMYQDRYNYELRNIYILHLYGHKHVGETPDDILFLDPDDAYAEYDLPMDFGDIPSGTSLQRMVALYNDSAGLDANNITVTVIDPDDQIRIGVTDVGPWLTTQTVVLLAHGDTSIDFYIKCEAPAPPTPLGPNRAPNKVQVGAWT